MTCYKNPSCIDLILTNRSNSFQNTMVVETGISDFHKMTVTVLTSFFNKAKPKIISYGDNTKFSSDNLIRELNAELSNYDITNITYEAFHNIFMSLLDKYAPCKLKYI